MADKPQLDKSKTFIDDMYIENFRSFHNQRISIGRNLTMISGVNGTGKSTVLGILAQICGFTINYLPNNQDASNPLQEKLTYRTIYNNSFESNFKDHFQISDKFDTPSEDYTVKLKINDAQEESYTDMVLRGTVRNGKKLRLVLRRSSSIATNTSRNITFPTYFLSLRRLTPFINRKHNNLTFKLTEDEKKELKDLTNQIFTSSNPLSNYSANDDGIKGVNSSIYTSDDYDIQSASTGEDNLGQIIGALLSFMRLKKEWQHYKGGLLLIDELDASIFPYAQKTLLKVLNTFSSKYKVQVVFTTHSSIIMQQMLMLKENSSKNTKTNRNYATNFISTKYGSPENNTEYGSQKMLAELNLSDLINPTNSKIHCYCEDLEAYTFVSSVINTKLKKKIKFMKEITLGGEQISTLIKNKIPEFKYQSLVIFDGDKRLPINTPTATKIPSKTPPDQLMYYLLDTLNPADSYWHQNENWDKMRFLNCPESLKIKADLEYNKSTQKYQYKVETTNHSKVIREYFKEWFNTNKKVLIPSLTNPITQIWKKENTNLVNNFNNDVERAISKVK